MLTALLLGGIMLGTTFYTTNKKSVKPEEAKQIAEEAYIFAYPMLEHYKMMFAMNCQFRSTAYSK